MLRFSPCPQRPADAQLSQTAAGAGAGRLLAAHDERGEDSADEGLGGVRRDLAHELLAGGDPDDGRGEERRDDRPRHVLVVARDDRDVGEARHGDLQHGGEVHPRGHAGDERQVRRVDGVERHRHHGRARHAALPCRPPARPASGTEAATHWRAAGTAGDSPRPIITASTMSMLRFSPVASA